MLILRNLCISIKQKQLLRDINFKLECGQFIGLLGTNGAGKTTLLRAIAGLINYSGEIEFNQILMSKLNRTDYAKQVAYLAQNQRIYWALSAQQIVSLGRLAHLSHWQVLSDKDQDVILDIMQQTATLEFAKRAITELSGGEQARVLLARAMAVQAPILLADEPTSSLDPYHQLRMMELLRQYADQGCLVIAVLHDFTLATHFCQQILLLHQGKLIAQGHPEQVLVPENLMKVYQLSKQDLNRIGFYASLKET